MSVDPKTGEVSFIKAGQATIKATKTEDENSFYETATATYTLNIAKGTQSTLHFVRQIQKSPGMRIILHLKMHYRGAVVMENFLMRSLNRKG